MPVVGTQVRSDYRILVRRGIQRSHASLIAFGLHQPIPAFTLPLLPGDDEPEIALNHILHTYTSAPALTCGSTISAAYPILA